MAKRTPSLTTLTLGEVLAALETNRPLELGGVRPALAEMLVACGAESIGTDTVPKPRLIFSRNRFAQKNKAPTLN